MEKMVSPKRFTSPERESVAYDSRNDILLLVKGKSRI